MSNRRTGFSEANRRRDFDCWLRDWWDYIRDAQPIELPQKTFDGQPHKRYIRSNDNNK